ncbi:MAG: type II toxin-antitoxin system VapC family toxin [Methanophagales archaeon]|nr:type II toxin-antitoxin system VapC family toxin [Methanophagales archaeon]
MIFLDANVFIYAYYKPKRKLTEKEKQMKEHAKDTITRINEGEEVLTTVVHLSEVSNILKRALSMEDLYSLLIGLFSMDNVRIVDVTTEDYLGAIELMNELKMDPNDCLAVDVMRREDINEIYTFDRGFDGVAGIIRVP